ncbi:MAG: imidazole glycerol phosphate synthase subunit HisH [Vicinamibacterales bacterium]
MIALVDYGAGNLTSVKKALAAIDADVWVPASPLELARASGVIVPGVGHFSATRALDDAWRDAILERLGEGRPLLGICVGMQWLFEGSAEAPDCPGLGVLAGACFRLQGGVASGQPAGVLKVPHVGWNALTITREAAIVDGIASGAQVYFTHSYAAPVTGDTVAATEHGDRFAAIVQRGQVSGVQFHPEKSSDVGLRILRNFIETAR